MRVLLHTLLFVMSGLLGWASLQAAQPATTRQAPAQAAAQAPVQSPADNENAAYVLGAGDVIEVDVLGQSEFKTRARIRTDGTIALPYLGNVNVQGDTPISFAQRVAAQLSSGGYYISPVVSVEVVGYASRYVIVLGAVAQPGIQPIDRNYRVSEMLARAGGIRDNAADYVTLVRAAGEELNLPYEKIARGGGADDPTVEAGDKLFVPLAELYYIYGQVNAPGEYPLKDQMTVRKAIARGGGLTASGSERRVSVYRGGEKVKLALNDVIQAGDVVVVGERLF